jgi:hypothetical protein
LQVENNRNDKAFGQVAASISKHNCISLKGGHRAVGQQDGDAFDRIGNIAATSTGIHANGATDGAGNARHVFKAAEPTAAQLGDKTKQVDTATNSRSRYGSHFVKGCLSKTGLIQPDHNPVDPVVIDEYIRATTKHPNGHLGVSGSANEFGCSFNRIGRNKHVRAATNAIPRHWPNGCIGNARRI